MNWLDLINNSEIVYASTLEDKEFRTWSLKKTTCNVSFYESYPVENIDKIICTIIENAGGTIAEERLATVLGFNVVDNFDVTPKCYADSAELDIFRAIVEPVKAWGLLIKEKKTNIYLLTDLGRRALETEVKHRFYTGQKLLFENSNIKPAELQKNVFFPFYIALGVYSEMTSKQQIDYDKISQTVIFDIDETNLIKRHKLQCKEIYQIYKSEITNYFSFESCQVDIRLFKHDKDYYPIIFYNNQISVEATELLYLTENIGEKEKKIEWGLYLKLIKDPNAVLDYETIIPFEDLLELDTLINDTRLVWGDNELFNYVTQNANANQWHAISNQCPIDVIKVHIDKHIDEWDWTSLSLRIDHDFLIETATKYPWNFEAISAQEEISIEILKTLVLIPELREQEWDWARIMPLLDFEFIKSNIEKIDFELSELTKANINDVQPLIIQYPGKKWDWAYISTNFELSFILNNLLVFKRYIQLKNVIARAFTSAEFVGQFCKSDKFKAILKESKETILRDYSANQAGYIWTTDLIDLLDNTKYLTWESGNYVLGFECNPSINWSYDFFRKYHSKIATIKGYAFVSRSVTDPTIVVDYIEFNWDWNEISANSNLISDKEFVLKVANRLNFGILLQKIDHESLELLFEKAELLSYLEQNPASWLTATKKASIEFVRKHIDYNWDWSILTTRFCASIKIEALGNSKWIEKWDWKYLTQNLDLSKIGDNLDLYVTYWDWDYLSEKFDKELILSNLLKYNNRWNWVTLLNNRFDKTDLLLTSHLGEVVSCIFALEENLQTDLWQIITRKFDYAELENLISVTYKNQYIHWDFAYFYSLPNFNLRSYLQNFSKYIDWKELSSCKKLNNELFFDKKLFNYKIWINDVYRILGNTEYLWDFKALSKNNNINWNDDVLEQYITLWDWEYLSLHSQCFRKDENQFLRVSRFKSYIDFASFSERNDFSITESLISNFKKYKWNWQAISRNPTITLTAKFISKYKDKDWDWSILSEKNIAGFNNENLTELIDKDWNWELISSRSDIDFTIELFEKLQDKPLNWNVVSERKEVQFSEKLIIYLKDKPLNWESVSRNKSFVPNATTLSILKGKALEWEAISQSENLTVDCLWDYRENLNWNKITKNKIFEISDSELLSKYQDFIDWRFISNSGEFKLTIDNLNQFKDRLHWGTINERKDFYISEGILKPFADVLNWSIVSQSMDIKITEELIEKYRNNWDWSLLRKNPQVIERIETSLKKYKAEFNCADFIERFHSEPYIYHFTHLFNAIDIIKSRKILSRHKADGKFANAAGNLVDRRDTAHNFARFYFRPQTPTQFYNECLGWDASLITSYGKSYYPQARTLGLPKCPIPVFFKFSLKEVLMKIPNLCFHSTGNMQTDRSRVIKISDNPNLLQTDYLFDNISDAFSMAGGPFNYNRQRHISIMERIKEYSQQEFLIEEEFDFSELNSFEIICYDDEQAKLLKAQLGEDSICEKINSNSWNTFHRGNRKLHINETDIEITISSDYRDSAYLSIQGEGITSIQILNPEKIQKETASEIIAYPEIRFTKTDRPIEVHFVDLTIGTRDWLIYKNGIAVNNFTPNNLNNASSIIDRICEKNSDLIQLFDSKVRHYTIRRHTEIVCNQFVKYFENIEISIDHGTFINFLALHDIGKPIAESEGNRHKQHSYTLQIINDNWDKLFNSNNNKAIIMNLASSDCIGEYFQKKKQISDVIFQLDKMVEDNHIDRKSLFYLFMIYYQCDVSAYTADAGGYKYLEHLFDYDKNGLKIFDEQEKIIRFSTDYWKMYLDLKTQIWQ